VREVVINTAWLEEQIVAALGDGTRFGLALHYSLEGRDHGGALETAGGIAKALPLLGDVFWVVSADIWAPDFRYSRSTHDAFVASGRLGRLWLVPNPHFHPGGDFGLGADGLGLAEGTGPDGQRWTYANIALLRAEMFEGIAPGTTARLAPLLYAGMRARRIGAEVWRGRWENVGTPEQLEALNARPPERRLALAPPLVGLGGDDDEHDQDVEDAQAGGDDPVDLEVLVGAVAHRGCAAFGGHEAQLPRRVGDRHLHLQKLLGRRHGDAALRTAEHRLAVARRALGEVAVAVVDADDVRHRVAIAPALGDERHQGVLDRLARALGQRHGALPEQPAADRQVRARRGIDGSAADETQRLVGRRGVLLVLVLLVPPDRVAAAPDQRNRGERREEEGLA
jgi:MurNAc alpha-1-phosphate uridylyltransferase